MPTSRNLIERDATRENDVTEAPSNETDVSLAETARREWIARRAYDRFQARGGTHGLDQQDWFEAERDLDESAMRDDVEP